MLYVFHVDTGTMLTFDMNLAMENVYSLQSVIARGCRIAEDKQVLLISGGESLDPSAVVGKYHAGTDTNPIFLFSKSTIESLVPPSPSVNYGSDIDLQGQVEGSLLMPPAYETVVSRAQLALQFQDVDTEELRACERLIHDQHLQQQGWSAVVANLEDVTGMLNQRLDTFHESYEQYLGCRQMYRDLISSVSDSLQLLSKIPVLSSLVQSHDTTSSTASGDGLSKLTLFQWISSQDTNHTLHDMVEQCDKATEQLDQKVDESLRSEVDQLLREVQNDGMKEVKGLEDRLYGLDQIICGARKVLLEQAELAQGFVQNQNRLSNVRDRSILPDLCSSHRNQLVEMSRNHAQLREIKKKCRMAKEELSVNLHTRLRWVMYVEKKICDVDGKLTIYLGNLRRLRKRLDILQQVQDSPKVYAQLVIEVVRRRQFSTKFLEWASSLAEDSSRLHSEEVKRRDSFLRLIGHHFLQSMFHGFDEYPPAFATESPDVFDNGLPDISVDDIKHLKQSVPELSGVLSEPADDDWLHLINNPKNCGVQWVADAGNNLPVVKPSIQTLASMSEIELVPGDPDHLQPYTVVEGGSISLGDQFTECEQEEDILRKPNFGSMSPPDKEFLLPKSLSEELTQEMRDLKQKPTLITGAERVKSEPAMSQSPGNTHSHPANKHKPSPLKKPTVDMSPDMDTSHEFTTADFYIDESMPSSIESPPKTSAEVKCSLEQRLTTEKQTNVKAQQELHDCNTRLTHSEHRLKCLKLLIDENLPVLQEGAKLLKSEQSEYVQRCLTELGHVRQSLLAQINVFGTNVIAKYESVIEQQKQDNASIENKYSSQLAETNDQVKDLQQRLTAMTDDLRISKEKEDRLTIEKDEIALKYEGDISDMTLKHELELEVEIDKAKSDLAAKVACLEKEVDGKDSVIRDKEHAINDLRLQQVKLEEELTRRFQIEKDTIISIMGAEYDEKLEKAVSDEHDKSEVMKQSLVAEMNEKHEKDKQKQLDDLKTSLMIEKEQAVELTQSTLTLEHTKHTDDIKGKLLSEQEEKNKLRNELETNFQLQLAQFSSEFNKEKEQLQMELDKYVAEKEIQKQQQCSMFNSLVVVETQTEVAELMESQVQTEIPDQFTSSVQTDVCEFSVCCVQTDSTQTMHSSIQTEKFLFLDCHIQTEATECMESGVQTDTPDQCSNVTTEGTAMVQDPDDNGNMAPTTASAKDTYSYTELQQRLEGMKEEHAAEISALITKLEQEKEDAMQLKSSLTSMTGDKQTRFNEAVNRVSQEKDKVIEELKNKERELSDQLTKYAEEMNKVKEEKCKVEQIKERALSLLKDKEREYSANQQRFESDLGLAHQQLKQYMEQLHNMGSDSADTSHSVVKITDPEEPALHQRIKDLEDVVRSKDEEIGKMHQKVMELSMTASTRSLVQDKVSITSCHVGDLVLLCLDERLDQYVVFTVGSTLHFLHTECLSPLGLKLEVGEPKKQWLIAEVIDKEYCQAKKPNNRFKVPVGTKFYRVKARRWTRETTNQSPVKKSDTASAPS